MTTRWTQELWRLVGLLTFCLVVGLLTGHVRDFLILGLAGAIAWHLYNLNRLLDWLGASEGFDQQEVGGVWGEIYYRVHQLQRRNRKRKRKIAKVLAQFRASAEAMPDAAVALGVNWEIHWFNEAATQMLGLRQAQDVGQTILNLLRNPEFHAYLNAGQFDRSLEIGAPGQHRPAAVGPGDPLSPAASACCSRRTSPSATGSSAFARTSSRTPRTSCARPLTVISGFLENLRHDESRLRREVGEPAGADGAADGADAADRGGPAAAVGSGERARSATTQEAVDVAGDGRGHPRGGIGRGRSGGPRDHRRGRRRPACVGNSQYLRSAFSNLVVNAVQHTPAGAGSGCGGASARGGRACSRCRTRARGSPPSTCRA